MPSRVSFNAVIFLTISIGLSACGGGSSALSVPSVASTGDHHKTGSTPIQHIVLMVQENRTFNNLFATFPGTTGTITGLQRTGTGKNAKTITVNLTEVPLKEKRNLNHLYVSYHTAYRNGNMDAFNLIKFATNGLPEGDRPYVYVNPTAVQPYWTIASQYGIADMMFQTQGSGSFTAHQDLIRGGTEIDPTESLVDDPTTSQAWGCNSPVGATTHLITTKLVYEKKKRGPYPCTSHFPSSGSNYLTLADLFATGGITWKYYAPPDVLGGSGALWNGFAVINSIYNNPSEWSEHVVSPPQQIIKDAKNGKLAQMSWVIPDGNDSDHPAYNSDKGPSWVAQVVNGIGQSPEWSSTAIIVVWDDWGGFYDEVPPPKLDKQGGPGFRVAMIVASPYVPANEISHTVYGFGSIIRFIEENWNLGSLGTTDATSTSIANMFDFTQKPRKFKIISAKYSQAFFLHQKPSNLPVDNQ
ncbi:MAG TPA: alkaline phosphatase family protein [Candidatus Cybelea sp.]|jgi:phospholipase C|nr:alkaline phosphatase family protein [Candidatus Cybelea sp.]